MVQKETKKEKIRRDLRRKYGWKLITIILFALLLISMFSGGFKDFFRGQTLSSQKAAEEAVDFINTDLLQGMGEAVLKDVSETAYLYKLNIEVDGQEFESYLTKDGKLLFPQGIEMEEKTEKVKTPATTGSATTECDSTPKQAKPKIEVYYMSYCPFGIQAIQGIAPAIKLLGDKVDFEPHYVVYENYRGGGPDYCIDNGKLCSMHGIKELNEDIRQACVWNYEKSKFWDYTLCTMDGCSLSNIDTCWKTCAGKYKVDIAKVEKCLEEEGVSLMTKEKGLNDKLGVSGSPIIFINGESYSGGRSPENFKQGMCCGFTEQPDECDQVLGTATKATAGSC